MSTRIQQTFETLKSNGQMAFMPFVTAGDPDMTGTQKLISTLAATGVDLIEVGFPYSDPIADGPVIQSSYTRALNKKLTVHQIFDAVSELPTDELPPLVAMVSYAIIFRIGPKVFVESARDAGFSGFIIPDLPGDEAEEMFSIVSEAGLDLIQLVAPTTPRERVRAILKACSGFVYCIAVAGTTGTRDTLQTDLLDQLAWLRAETSLPLAVGFGISKPEHVDPLRNLADGVIVGSGIVRHLNEIDEGPEALDAALEAIATFSTSMVQATKTS
ncbi:MAG: tryptophan synthase subunit alpha [Planctomycetaceae bacterium]